MQDEPPVDYDTDIALFADATYYYKAREEFIFMDPNCLNERMTSTSHTARCYNFRTDITQQDGEFCVITGDDTNDCDAAHLIPRSRGDEYARQIVQDRAPRYEDTLHSSITGVNDVKNGLLVSKSLHSKLSNGTLAFLKTPGFGLGASDIPKLNRGSISTDCITLHRLEEPLGFSEAALQVLTSSPVPFSPSVYFGANVDALFHGTGNSPPSTIILDYMYGVAAYNF